AFRLHDAGNCLDLWMERDPDNTQALLLQAEVFAARDHLGGAIENCRRVLQLDPEHDEARRPLCGSPLHPRQPPGAERHLEYLNTRLPGDALVEIYRARCRDQLGRPEEAVQILDALLARQPDNVGALYERGKLAIRLKDPAAAENLLRKAAGLAPGDYQ